MSMFGGFAYLPTQLNIGHLFCCSIVVEHLVKKMKLLNTIIGILTILSLIGLLYFSSELNSEPSVAHTNGQAVIGIGIMAMLILPIRPFIILLSITYLLNLFVKRTYWKRVAHINLSLIAITIILTFLLLP
jgi:hypothetical protein